MTAIEADRILSEWVNSGIQVCFAMEFGQGACFIQRIGKLRYPPTPVVGMFLHYCNETLTTVWTAKYGEILFVDGTTSQSLRFIKPSGAEGVEVTLIVDFTGKFEADSYPLLSNMIQ